VSREEKPALLTLRIPNPLTLVPAPPHPLERLYRDYVFWCERLEVPSADFATWRRETAKIAAV
jgi:hypothetical protein